MKFLLPNSWYDALKWICMVLIPALTTAYVGISSVFGLPYAEEVAKTSAIVCTLIGTLLGISTAEYRSTAQAETESVEEPNG